MKSLLGSLVAVNVKRLFPGTVFADTMTAMPESKAYQRQF
jgi:hypothetical protein